MATTILHIRYTYYNMNKFKTLEERLDYLESLLLNEEDKDNKGVIRKVGNKWKILKKNRKDYWDADYKTKSDAEDALKAYWANKNN